LPELLKSKINYYSKTQRIVEICRGRHVLHIGCVGFTDLKTSDRVASAKQSLHYALTKCARTIGVDYSEESIQYLSENGIFDNIVYGNAEKLQELRLTPGFDVIVAGDIIEHLSNPGRMLDGIHALCRADTLVVITTPHAFGLLTFLRHLSNRFVEGREHVFTMNMQNLINLADRHGFEVLELATCYQDHATKSLLFKVGRDIFNRFPRLGGTLFAVFHPRATTI
jgi:2-polyprenyl-3-methyl-5-hydroxy-6-metoxy-1,4-benzoquinol methylase